MPKATKVMPGRPIFSIILDAIKLSAEKGSDRHYFQWRSAGSGRHFLNNLYPSS